MFSYSGINKNRFNNNSQTDKPNYTLLLNSSDFELQICLKNNCNDMTSFIIILLREKFEVAVIFCCN